MFSSWWGSRAQLKNMRKSKWVHLPQVGVNKYMIDTVDGRNPKQPFGMVLKPVVNNWINYQPQLVNAGFLPFINCIAFVVSNLL